jgi:hypothetical protein
MTYRIFIEDVGAQRFSAFAQRNYEASTPLEAIFRATHVVRSSPVGTQWRNGKLIPRFDGMRLIALPLTRQDLWPNATTLKVPSEALKLGISNES